MKAGEYLLAVDGREVRPPANLFSFFENTAGKIVEITVSPHPDVEVEWTPADFAAWRDPQLEKAIEIALEELKKNPPVEPRRPPYPVKKR